jgi:hypothetical protein
MPPGLFAAGFHPPEIFGSHTDLIYTIFENDGYFVHECH